MKKYQLNSKILIEGEILVETGLLIGGTNSALDIGGADKQVIRNPVDGKPYIPGSSLKGKMRSLLEQSRGSVDEKGNPTQDPKTDAARLFGHIKSSISSKQQASRLIVRDGKFLNSKLFDDKELPYTEVKAENTINRITAVANPRFFERVPRSAKFALNMALNIYDIEDEDTTIQYLSEKELLDLVYECLRLVEDDYLGGGGSRGNGQVKFKITAVKKRGKAYYQTGKDADESNSLFNDVPEDLK